MRCFLAIELPDMIKMQLLTMQQQLDVDGLSVSWAKPEVMHLTLRFLGEVPDEDVPALSQSCHHYLTGASSCHLKLRGVGVFPNLKRVSVIWAGVDVLEGDLAFLRGLADKVAETIKIPKDNKPFHPHITLGRVKLKQGMLFSSKSLDLLKLSLNELKTCAGDAFDARAVALFSSTLHTGGARHKRIGEYLLT